VLKFEKKKSVAKRLNCFLTAYLIPKLLMENITEKEKQTSCKGMLRQNIAFVVKLHETYNFPVGFGQLKINGQLTSASRISNRNHQLRP
jgi:hypothetical protein